MLWLRGPGLVRPPSKRDRCTVEAQLTTAAPPLLGFESRHELDGFQTSTSSGWNTPGRTWNTTERLTVAGPLSHARIVISTLYDLLHSKMNWPDAGRGGSGLTR